MGEPIVRAAALTKFYGRQRGIVDLDLEIGAGEVFGYLGPNGAGKTTTIRLLLDYLRPTRGSASLFGLDPPDRDVRPCRGEVPVPTVTRRSPPQEGRMPLSRRRLLATAAAIPIVIVVERGIRLAADGTRAAVTALRPSAQGTSATRCGLCGSPDHTMLDPRCPAARSVL